MGAACYGLSFGKDQAAARSYQRLRISSRRRGQSFPCDTATNAPQTTCALAASRRGWREFNCSKHLCRTCATQTEANAGTPASAAGVLAEEKQPAARPVLKGADSPNPARCTVESATWRDLNRNKALQSQVVIHQRRAAPKLFPSRRRGAATEARCSQALLVCGASFAPRHEESGWRTWFQIPRRETSASHCAPDTAGARADLSAGATGVTTRAVGATRTCRCNVFWLAHRFSSRRLRLRGRLRPHRQEEVGPLLLQLSKNGFWVWSASAWTRTPSRFSSPSNCRSTALSWFSPVA